MKQDALRLADWILANASTPISALKLQKLLFYTYGAAQAHDVDHLIGRVDFVAWKHGPVSIPVYEHYKPHQDALLPVPSLSANVYDGRGERVLRDALTVYDRLSPWQLREESHLERPWKEAWDIGQRPLDPETLRAHFKKKFRSGAVRLPEHLSPAWSLQLDRIPVATYPTLHALAVALRPAQ